MAYRAGLTGNVASGKSSVAAVWRREGTRVIDADELAREAVVPGSPALAAIRDRFGDGVLLPDRRLDRAALRRIVFGDPAARAALEAIVHPEVARLRAAEERAAVDAGHTLVVHEIPLLFETGLDAEMDVVVLVDAPEDERLRRLVELRGLHAHEARAMMESQLPAADKRARADVVIDNDGDLAALERRALQVLEGLRAGAATEDV